MEGLARKRALISAFQSKLSIVNFDKRNPEKAPEILNENYMQIRQRRKYLIASNDVSWRKIMQMRKRVNIEICCSGKIWNRESSLGIKLWRHISNNVKLFTTTTSGEHSVIASE